jgi:two-component system nitrogen regulation sensor histidine kinase NtrY
MLSKSFRWRVAARVFLLVGFFIGGTYLIFQTPFWLLALWCYLGFILGVFELIRFVEKGQRDLHYFLLSIKEGDFSTSYPYKKREELNYAFDTINKVLNELRNEKASNLIYLQTVVEHISIALICLDHHEVVLKNRAAEKLLGTRRLKTIDKLIQINEALGKACASLLHGQQLLLKPIIGGIPYTLSLEATEFRLRDKSYKLISFKDIKSELEANELESWQKLIRVLTHEIKNSAIPISTLSDVILQMIKDNQESLQGFEDQETFADILGGLTTIQSRSKGLVDFVTTYDRLSKIPQPKIQRVTMSHLTSKIVTLMAPDLEANGILIKTKFEQGLSLKIDEGLIEQVLINLVKNASEACGLNGIITIKAFESDQFVHIEVSDNGPGIPHDILENIFVPFYTTKNQGSGIGLSLSRQIMKAHHGNISVVTNSSGTTFSLSFPV